MREITQATVKAFLSRGEMSASNTTVKDDAVYLHGNMIAKYIDEQLIEVNFCGYPTNVTKARINAIVRQFSNDRYSVSIKKGELYLNCAYKPSQPIDSDGWIAITKR